MCAPMCSAAYGYTLSVLYFKEYETKTLPSLESVQSS